MKTANQKVETYFIYGGRPELTKMYFDKSWTDK